MPQLPCSLHQLHHETVLQQLPALIQHKYYTNMTLYISNEGIFHFYYSEQTLHPLFNQQTKVQKIRTVPNLCSSAPQEADK